MPKCRARFPKTEHVKADAVGDLVECYCLQLDGSKPVVWIKDVD
jgi:hypothetical protein